MLPLPDPPEKDWVVGEIDGEQDAAAWVTVNVAPAIVSVPVRLDATVFAATLNPTVPLPEPVAPLVIGDPGRIAGRGPCATCRHRHGAAAGAG